MKKRKAEKAAKKEDHLLADHSGTKKNKNMGKAKDKLEWFGEKGKDGAEVVKLAGKAIVVAGALAVTGAVLGTVGNMFSGGNN